MSILDKIPSLAENELFQKLAALEDITALSKEDQEKYDDAIKVMRDHIAAYKGAFIEAKIATIVLFAFKRTQNVLQ